MLDGIVLRHRRLRVRRARAAVTVALVIVVAGAGLDVGLSHRGTTTSAISPRSSGPVSPSLTSPAFAATGGAPPKGLGWVAVGSGILGSAEFSPAGTSSRTEAGTSANGLSTAGRLKVTGSYAGTESECAVLGCTNNPPFAGAARGVLVRHLFTRTSGGVTVRAFTAVWALAPLELLPVTSGATPSRPPTTGNGGTGVSGGASAGTSRNSTTSVASTTPVSVTPGTQRVAVPVPVPALSCAVTRSLIVEVSDAGAVGVVTVPLGPSPGEPMTVLEDEVVGVAERSPIAVVVSHTAGSASAVRADFSGGGTDEMKVVDGWAVLVHQLKLGRSTRSGSNGVVSPLGGATVEALNSDGTVLEMADLPESGALALAVGACAVPLAQGSSHSGSVASTGKPNGG